MKPAPKSVATLNDRGDLSAEPGSRDWAIAVRLEILSLLANNESSAKHLRVMVLGMQERQGYKHLFNERGQNFRTFEEFCIERQPFGLGYQTKAIERIIEERENIQGRARQAEPLRTQGRPKSVDKLDIVKITKGGNSSEYLLRKLAREAMVNPAVASVLKAVKRGEYRSVRAAAIDAGIVKPDSPLVLLKRAWTRASQSEQEEFIEWINGGGAA